MNIQTVDEHSFCPDLLTEHAVILDAGCRGMGFANHFRSLGHEVLAIDIDKLGHGGYVRFGLADRTGIGKVHSCSDPNATLLQTKKSLVDPFADILNAEDVYIGTIEYCSSKLGKQFDLIKLDIEGEEYPILKEAKHPIAKQVSCEFHAHTGANTKQEIDELLDWLGQWCDIYGRVWEKRHGCSENYWDVLLIAK